VTVGIPGPRMRAVGSHCHKNCYLICNSMGQMINDIRMCAKNLGGGTTVPLTGALCGFGPVLMFLCWRSQEGVAALRTSF
jgi:hypothetical protein